MSEMPDKPAYAWLLKDMRPVRPFPVKGRLHLFDVPEEQIEDISALFDDQCDADIDAIYTSLFV